MMGIERNGSLIKGPSFVGVALPTLKVSVYPKKWSMVRGLFQTHLKHTSGFVYISTFLLYIAVNAPTSTMPRIYSQALLDHFFSLLVISKLHLQNGPGLEKNDMTRITADALREQTPRHVPVFFMKFEHTVSLP